MFVCRKRFLPILAFGCAACSASRPAQPEPSVDPTSDPGAALVVEPALTADLAANPPAGSLAPLTSAQLIEALIAAGCPAEGASASGCDVCPAGISKGDGDDTPVGFGPVVTSDGIFEIGRVEGSSVTGLSGSFALGGDRLLFFSGCGLKNGSLEQDSLLHLTRAGELTGTIERLWHYGVQERECAAPRDASGARHVLCVLAWGEHGVEFLEVRSLHAPSPRDIGGSPPDEERLVGGPPIVESEVRWSDDGEERVLPPSHRLTFASVEDLDGDGDDDVVMRRGVAERWHLIQGEGGVFVWERVE